MSPFRPLKAQFNIYGLPVEIQADHPLLFETFAEDLRGFRIWRSLDSRRKVRLSLTALPASINGNAHLSIFAPHEQLASYRRTSKTTSVTCYGKSAVTVISDLKRRSIQAGIVPDASFLPDPAYHLCFTHSVSFWFKQRGLFCLHAGCVALQEKGILIAGPQRSGKSTLSYSAVRSGFKFLSDEQPILTLRAGEVRALAFPRRIRLDAPVAKRFPELRVAHKKPEPQRLIFRIEEIWRNSLAASCAPHIIVFPAFQLRGSLRINRLTSMEALGRLLQDDHFVWYRNKPWDRLSHQHLNLLEQLTRQASAFSLHYGTKDVFKIPDTFRQLLRHG